MLGLSQRGMNTPYPGQAPGANVPLGSVDPAAASAPGAPLPGDAPLPADAPLPPAPAPLLPTPEPDAQPFVKALIAALA